MSTLGAQSRNSSTGTCGDVAILFGLMIFVIFGGAGIAIDMQRSNAMRAEVMEATDTAVLRRRVT